MLPSAEIDLLVARHIFEIPNVRLVEDSFGDRYIVSDQEDCQMIVTDYSQSPEGIIEVMKRILNEGWSISLRHMGPFSMVELTKQDNQIDVFRVCTEDPTSVAICRAALATRGIRI